MESQSETESDIIKEDDYVIIQRQNYMKLKKIKSSGMLQLRKDEIELKNIIGKKYYSTFKMVSKPNYKKIFTLEESDYVTSIQNLNIEKSGDDNRNIFDDGSSQMLSKEEIIQLREEDLSSSDIVEKLITNSKTFHEKTEYSQAKYLKKKEKKYFEYIQVRKPSIRLLTEMYQTINSDKAVSLRSDELSQILTYANVHCDSNVLLYDSGSHGLLSASIMNAIGKNTKGNLIYAHPGNVSQKEAFLALQFPKEQVERCVEVCLYSVLRCFFQEFKKVGESPKNDQISTSETSGEIEDKSVINRESLKNDEISVEKVSNETEVNSEKEKLNEFVEKPNLKRKFDDVKDLNLAFEKVSKIPCWKIANQKACKILSNQIDALIIVTKEHPLTIFNELSKFLGYGKPFVIYSKVREILQELYVDIKSKDLYIGVNLSKTFLRNYQVLENRTHPDVNMTCGGYLLSGYKVDYT